MMSIAALLELARSYAAHESVKLTTVSSRVFNDGKKLSALEAGGDLHSRRLHDAMQWLSANWPADLDWPAEIPRPEPAKGD
jgi:hypothetical protein